ncbi:MAG: hypothetical protein WBL66_15970, partial [Candidatus Acidiferrales bacterium]
MDVAGKKAASALILFEEGVEVAKSQCADEEVGLFTRAEFRNRLHFLLNPSERGRPLHGADFFVLVLDIVDEVEMVGAMEDEHAFCCGRSLEEFVHASEGKGNVVLGDEVEGRDIAIPGEREGDGKNA